MRVVRTDTPLRLLMVAAVVLVGLIYVGILSILLLVGLPWWLSVGAVVLLVLGHLWATDSLYRAILRIGLPARRRPVGLWIRRMARRVLPWLVVPLAPILVWLMVSRDLDSLLPVLVASAVLGIAELPVGALLVYMGVGRSRDYESADPPPAPLTDKRSKAGEAARILDALCQRHGIATPRFFVASSNVPNAWAMGWSPRMGTVGITFGLLGAIDLTGEELESVLAHEVSHLVNRDSAIMQIAAVPAVALDFVCASLISNPASGAAGLLSWAMAAVLYPFVLLAKLITVPLSREREYVADRSGAILTGNPKAAASALRKASAGVGLSDPYDLKSLSPASSLMFVRPTTAAISRWADRVFATHPTVERRIRALEALDAQLGGTPSEAALADTPVS